MDLSKFSNEDLTALQAGDLSKISDTGLTLLQQPKSTPSLLSTAANAVVKGAAGFADTFNPKNVAHSIYNIGGMLGGTAATALGYPEYAPNLTAPTNTFQDVAKKAGLIRPEAEPTDILGRVVDMTGQIAGGGGINPAALGCRESPRESRDSRSVSLSTNYSRL